MNIKRRIFWQTIVLWVVFGFLSEFCTSSPARAQPQTGLSTPRMELIAVMPFFKGKCEQDIGGPLDCPISQLDFETEKVFPDSDQILTGYVQEALRKRYGERMIPLKTLREAHERITRNEAQDTLRTLGQKLGGSLGANFIVVGTVWRYKKRVEDTVAGETPASVAFAVYLIDVANGKTLWKGSFKESQGVLSENILDARAFFKKGAKWLSADELARYGVKEVLEEFPL